MMHTHGVTIAMRSECVRLSLRSSLAMRSHAPTVLSESHGCSRQARVSQRPCRVNAYVRSLHIYKHYSRAERCGDLFAVTLRQRLRPLVDQLDVVAGAYHALLHDGTVQPQVRAPRPQRRALPTED